MGVWACHPPGLCVLLHGPGCFDETAARIDRTGGQAGFPPDSSPAHRRLRGRPVTRRIPEEHYVVRLRRGGQPGVLRQRRAPPDSTPARKPFWVSPDGTLMLARKAPTMPNTFPCTPLSRAFCPHRRQPFCFRMSLPPGRAGRKRLPASTHENNDSNPYSREIDAGKDLMQKKNGVTSPGNPCRHPQTERLIFEEIISVGRAARRTASYGFQRLLLVTNRGKIVSLFVSQTVYRIRQRRLDRLKTDREERDDERQRAGH